MGNYWFTADTHFDHLGALKFRPMFESVQEMNEHIIEKWNGSVKKGDHIYHLGDFGFFKADRMLIIKHRLNGDIHLVKGNHDDKLRPFEKALFTSISDLRYIKVNKQKIMLCHYAMKTWRSSHNGSWHLYGHSHGNLADDINSLSLDVGVDCNNFTPVSFDEIKQRMEKKTFVPIDHHGVEND